ncbi:transposase [Enterococcus faecalis]|nr:transposase [Enterococcus faecalis]
MFYTGLIKETLNIIDLNVTFEENCLGKEKINGQICKVYTEKLTYLPDSCEHCAHHSTIICWGMTTVRLLLNEVAEFKIYLALRKQRFKCHTCQRTFVADASIAEKHVFISQSVKWTITTRLKENASATVISRQKRYFFTYSGFSYLPSYPVVPTVLVYI